MFEKEEIKRLQEILMNSWPARHYYFLNGWVLRFTDGVTARANSVFPLNYTGKLDSVDKDIKIVEKAYNTYNLPAIFTIPEYFEPSILVDRLLEQGYQQLGCVTHTMIMNVQNLRTELINEEFIYDTYSERVSDISDFLANYSHRDKEDQNVLDALVKRIIIPQKRLIVAKMKNKVIGTLMGILDPQKSLYIVDMLIHPDFRRQKIATSMYYRLIKDWGIPNGVKMVWLQVEAENVAAMNLYNKLGLTKAYSYYYLEKK
ncbi:MAG: GNAT family N-acetyltransferase [Promethearchaeota archaeon]|nr:MAG: GNAT family N-acetyltransferase [Candidatus Lokiarchaeota archaeon]